MIQEERERRLRLQAEEETRVSDEQAKLRAEREKLIQENTASAQKDRDLLIALQIPQYLQEIIDEEKLKGAYVLWTPIHHANLGPEDTSVMGGEVSLVWNIGYTERYHQVTHGGSDEMRSGGGTRVSWESTGKRSGYAYKAISVHSNSKDNSVRINGRKDDGPVPAVTLQDIINYSVRNNLGLLSSESVLRAHLYPNTSFGLDVNGNLVERRLSHTSRKLSDLQLSPPQIKQALASTYLDTKKSLATERWPSWEFERTVPELDHGHISERFEG